MGYAVELNTDQAGDVIRLALQDAYLDCLSWYLDCRVWPVDDAADTPVDIESNELLHCLNKVIEYFSTPDQYEEWKNQYKGWP